MKKKRFHILRENKGNKLYDRLLFFDTETSYIETDKRQEHFLKLGVVTEHLLSTGQERTRTFYNVEDFWNFVLDTKAYTTIIFAHNMHFDLNVVKGLLKLGDYGFEIELPVFESSTFILVTRNVEERKRIIFLDTFNYFKTSLEKIGEMLGEQKLDIDFDKCSLNDLRLYCMQDVRIIKQLILKWMEYLEEHNLGNMKYTAASQSFTAFRHKYMQHDICIHANPEVIKLEQDSYRGGRTEAFFVGDLKDISVVDINSLYPFVMKHFDFPIRLVAHKEGLTQKDIEYLINEGYLVVAECEIQTDKNVIGVKHEIGESKKLIFPVGTFTVTLTNPEINLLLSTGGKINRVGKLSVYEKGNIFTHFVTENYALRRKYQKENNFVFSEMVKLILNSLYGKFGQQQRLLRRIGDAPPDLVLYEYCVDADTGKRFTQLIFGGGVWINERTTEESFNSFTAIASYVTAYARTYLYLLMQIPDNVYYCDTDSLMIQTEELTRFGHLIGTDLGLLKLEYSGENIRIYGAKDYEIDELKKHKGIKLNAVEIAPNTFQQLHFMKTKSLIKNETLDRVIVETVEKKCKRIYDKGVICNSGKVLPLEL